MYTILFASFLLILTWFLHTVFAISGLGAGIILIPSYIALGIAVTVSVTAGLLMNIVSLSTVTMHNANHRIVMWKLGTLFVIPAVVLAPLGAALSSHISARLIIGIFIALLIFAFYHVIRKSDPGHREKLTGRPALLVAIAVGAVAGILSGISGIGGGLIVLSALTFMEEDYRKIVGTTGYVALFVSVASLTSHYADIHLIPAELWVIILAGSIMGGITASYLLHVLKPRTISYVTGTVILIIVAVLIFDIM